MLLCIFRMLIVSPPDPERPLSVLTPPPTAAGWRITSTHPDSKVHGANMGPIWDRQAPCLSHEPCYLGRSHWSWVVAIRLQREGDSTLTDWGRVTHICVSKLSILGSDNGLSPGRCQAIILTNAGILLIWPLGTNFSGILIEIDIFLLKKKHLKMSSAKWRPFCLGLNVLKSGER